MEKLSIVLPCYNPQEGWEQRILTAYGSISEKLGFGPEIILVNDGSKFIPDLSLSALATAIPSFLFTSYKENKGKGYALRHGVAKATGEYIIFTDIDFPYDIESMEAVWNLLNSNYDIVAGVKDKTYYDGVPLFRIGISRILRKLIGVFFSMPITDTQCGLKGFNQKGKRIFLNTVIDRYLCDLEFIYKGYRARPALNICAQPAKLREDVFFRKMNWRILLTESINFVKIAFSKK